MDSLARKALLGDKQAQEKCTAKGIVLPCPCCKNESELLTEEGAFNGETPRQLYYIRCKSCFLRSGLYTSKIAALNKWNTRPAPLIGRCGECKYGRKFSQNDSQHDFHWEETEIFMICKEPYICTKRRVKTLHTPDEYCSHFEPREE